jgi:signal transduction histidine kinase
MGYMDILEEKVTEEDRYYFHKIKNSLNRLIEIINDLVKLEKIEYANLFGDFEQVSLEKVSNRAIEILKPLADRKNIELRLKENKPEISIRGIEEILYYCVYNLMENALKYHEPGSGYVKVELQDEKEMIRILICDDGPGIPPQYREDIFRRFYRLSKGRTNSDGSAGSGLGLSIVREGVRFHDGKVICKDNPEGKGTCFEMCFPKLNP